MSYSEEYKEHIKYTFAAFCNVVLRNAAMSAYRDLGRQQKREISLDYLMEEKYFNPSTTDSYFEKQIKPTIFLLWDFLLRRRFRHRPDDADCCAGDQLRLSGQAG